MNASNMNLIGVPNFLGEDLVVFNLGFDLALRLVVLLSVEFFHSGHRVTNAALGFLTQLLSFSCCPLSQDLLQCTSIFERKTSKPGSSVAPLPRM